MTKVNENLKLINKLYKTNNLNKNEMNYLLSNMDKKDKELLFRYSYKTKNRIYGKSVFLRGLIEFSNFCIQDCLYCGLRASNKKVHRYRLNCDDIINAAKEGYNLGYRTFVLQSGEDPWYTKDIIIQIITKIKSLFSSVALTLSIGERPVSEYESFYKAGADRFLLRHETASKELFEKLHLTSSFENRISCLFELKRIGYQTGTGFMVGLPCQNIEDLVEDLLLIQKLKPEMIGIGAFLPHSQTPLKNASGGKLENTLTMVAMARLLTPDALIPATTVLSTLDGFGREKALKVGANVLMPNITPVEVRPHYQLYENKICIEDKPQNCRSCIENRITSSGLDLDMGKGDCIRKK